MSEHMKKGLLFRSHYRGQICSFHPSPFLLLKQQKLLCLNLSLLPFSQCRCILEVNKSLLIILFKPLPSRSLFSKLRSCLTWCNMKMKNFPSCLLVIHHIGFFIKFKLFAAYSVKTLIITTELLISKFQANQQNS